MKIIYKKIVKNSAGKIKLECQESEDFWHIYNLLRVGDQLTALTIRKISHKSSTGTTKQTKKRFHLCIEVDTIDYDTSVGAMRVKGKSVKENPYLSLGQSHTIELSLGRAFTIEKTKWDSIDLERLKMAANVAATADTAIVVMEYGLAHLVLITQHMTVIRAQIEKSIPRKRLGSSSRHDKGIARFYQLIMDSIVRHINFDVVKCVILASPAFIKDDFYAYMMKEAANNSHHSTEMGYRLILKHKHVFVKGHCSSGHKSAVKEVLNDPQISKQMASTKSIEQTTMLDVFFKLLNNPLKEAQAIYGKFHVQKANEAQQIRTLMITDNLFRSQNIRDREKYVKLVEDCKSNGATVSIFSSLHVSGEQLAQISGIAAILFRPMPELLDFEPEMEDQKADDNHNHNRNGEYSESSEEDDNEDENEEIAPEQYV